MSAADHTGYGLKSGALTFIADVPSGLACGCVCARCGQRLIAKKGPFRQHHFAHLEDTACHGTAESTLHLLAKELLAELKTFDAPPYNYHRRRKTRTDVLIQHRCVVTTGGPIPIHQVRVEERAGDFIPDIVIESATTSLIVEVAVTHKVERIKLRKLRRRNLPAIEIRLNVDDSFLPRDALKRKLQQDLPCKVWLFHPDQREAERTFAALYRQALAQARHRPQVTFTPTSHWPHPAARTYAPRPSATTSGWSEQNRLGEQFNRRYGRYPSQEECQTLWPDLFGNKKP